jgi:hypothetical protein
MEVVGVAQLLGLSLLRTDATPGGSMMNLKYRDERAVQLKVCT